MSDQKTGFFSHKTMEKNVGWLIVFSVLVISFAGLAQIVPLFFQHSTTSATPGVLPYEPLNLIGRDIYIREGCVSCHSQQIRMLSSEVQRYGPYSLAGESRYDHPFLWGSKRTGPDLHRVGGKYPDSWHFLHMRTPSATSPGSIMPGYPWLYERTLDDRHIEGKIITMRRLGVPYPEGYEQQARDDMRAQAEEIVGRLKAAGMETAPDREIVALIAYLQRLGTDIKDTPAPQAALLPAHSQGAR